MGKRLFSSLILLLLASSSISMMTGVSAQQGPTVSEIWHSNMNVNDVAVSRNSLYVAVVNGTGLYFYASINPNPDNPSPRWWYLTNVTTNEEFLSVAVSADGRYLVIGNNTMGSICYFDGGLTRTGLQPYGSWRWVSRHFGEYEGNSDVERRTIDISDNGEYVAVGGTGEDLYYFLGCTSRTGTENDWNWNTPVPGLVHAVDMSADGKYIAVGGPKTNWVEGYVVFFTDANTAGHTDLWSYAKDMDPIVDIAVSDDGYAVASVSERGLATLHYWANAKSASPGELPNTWNRTYPFRCVDLSSDGDRVVAGSPVTDYDGSLHYWEGARTLVGKDIAETWTRLEEESIKDVGINDAGTIIAAVIPRGKETYQGEVYFYASSGDQIGHFVGNYGLDKLSMSGSGETTAIGGVTEETLHVFRIPIAVGGEVLAPLVTPLMFLLFLLILLAGLVSGILLRQSKYHL